MIRIFHHYVHRASLRSMFFDLAGALMLALGAVTYQVGGLGQAVPLAGGQLMSFAAALFSTVTAAS